MSDDVHVTFGGDTGALEAASAIARAEINNLQKEMRTLAAEMSKTGASMDSEMGAKLNELGAKMAEAKAHSKELAEGLKAGKEGASEAGEGFDRLKESLLHIAEIAGIAFTADAFKEWVLSTTEAAEHIERLGHELGATPEQVQTLGAVAKLAGGDLDEMAGQLEKMQLGLAKIHSETSPAAQALKVLGVNVAEFRAMSMTSQLSDLAEAFSKFADGPAKTAAAMALLGRSGAEMIPYLDKGREGLAELNGVAQRTGVIMSDELVEAFGKTGEDVKELELAWRGFSQTLFSVVNGPVDAAVKGMSRLLESLRPDQVRAFTLESLQAIGDFAVGSVGDFEMIRADISSTEEYFHRLGLVIDQWSQAALTPIAKVTDAMRGLAASVSIAASLPGLLDKGLQGKGGAGSGGGAPGPYGGMPAGGSFDYEDSMSDVIKENRLKAALDISATKQTVEGYTKAIKDLFVVPKPVRHGEGEGGEAGAKPQVPQMQIGGAGSGAAAAKEAKDALDAQMEKDQEAVKSDQDATKQKLADIAELAKTHQITEAQKVAQSIAALNDGLKAETDVVTQESKLNGLTLREKQKLYDQIADLARANADEIKKLNREAAEQSAAQWKGYADTVSGLMDSQVNGLLRGTTSWSQAVKNMAASGIEDVIKFCIKWAAEHAATVAMNMAGLGAQTTATGVAAATQTGMVAGGVAAQKAINATSVTGDAARAAAGAYAAVSGIPVVGPILAPVAAAVAFGAVEAFGSFDIGAWDVPRDQLAMIHQNELVMPANLAGPFRDMLEGGGVTQQANAQTTHNHTWNVSSNSANPRDVAREVARQWNANPSLRPAY